MVILQIFHRLCACRERGCGLYHSQLYKKQKSTHSWSLTHRVLSFLRHIVSQLDIFSLLISVSRHPSMIIFKNLFAIWLFSRDSFIVLGSFVLGLTYLEPNLWLLPIRQKSIITYHLALRWPRSLLSCHFN